MKQLFLLLLTAGLMVQLQADQAAAATRGAGYSQYGSVTVEDNRPTSPNQEAIDAMVRNLIRKATTRQEFENVLKNITVNTPIDIKQALADKLNMPGMEPVKIQLANAMESQTRTASANALKRMREHLAILNPNGDDDVFARLESIVKRGAGYSRHGALPGPDTSSEMTDNMLLEHIKEATEAKDIGNVLHYITNETDIAVKKALHDKLNGMASSVKGTIAKKMANIVMESNEKRVLEKTEADLLILNPDGNDPVFQMVENALELKRAKTPEAIAALWWNNFNNDERMMRAQEIQEKLASMLTSKPMNDKIREVFKMASDMRMMSSDDMLAAFDAIAQLKLSPLNKAVVLEDAMNLALDSSKALTDASLNDEYCAGQELSTMIRLAYHEDVLLDAAQKAFHKRLSDRLAYLDTVIKNPELRDYLNKLKEWVKQIGANDSSARARSGAMDKTTAQTFRKELLLKLKEQLATMLKNSRPTSVRTRSNAMDARKASNIRPVTRAN